MKKIFFFILLFSSLYSENENRFYLITDICDKCDFNMSQFDKRSPSKESNFMIEKFPTKKGDFKIINFMNISYGFVSYSSQQTPIHYILSIKVDSKNKIIEAYHYNLEWQDSPEYKLYFMNQKDLFFRAGIELKDFNFKLKIDNVELDFNGKLDNVYRGKIISSALTK